MTVEPAATPHATSASRFVRYGLPGGVVVVHLPAHLAAGVLEEILRHDGEWLVVDVRDVAAPVEEVVLEVTRLRDAARRPRERMCVVARTRVTGADIVTFASIGDACLAKSLSEAGFGAGWSPEHPVTPGLAADR